MLHENIQEYCLELKLSGILSHYKDISDKAADEKMPYAKYLSTLLKYEINQRSIRSRQTLLKLASFPNIKSIDTFDFKSSSVDRTLINELLTLRFIDEQKNILLLGPSGVGKTHIALSLGYASTQHRFKTKFVSTNDLILQLQSAKIANTLDNYLKRVINPTKLLIIDEFGYMKLNEEQSNLLFQIVNKKYEQGSIIITSNLSFTKWKEVLNDNEALTAAILDRLIHHSYIINITGESYRLKTKRKAGLLNLTVKN